MNLVNLTNISVTRNKQSLLDNVSLSVDKGEIVTIVGPNGAGKSTLVKIALGLIKPTKGSVNIAPQSRIGYVPQSIDIDRTLPITVKRFLNLTKKNEPAKLQEVLEKVQAQPVLESPLQSLSGGEVRRILLARALLNEPDLLILDEPTAGVDVTGQAEMFTLIQTIRDQQRCGILLISHDLHVVMAATDKVVCLNRHLCCSGTPEHVRHHPDFVALFGTADANKFGIYAHHHDHSHDLKGNLTQENIEVGHYQHG